MSVRLDRHPFRALGLSDLYQCQEGGIGNADLMMSCGGNYVMKHTCVPFQAPSSVLPPPTSGSQVIDNDHIAAIFDEIAEIQKEGRLRFCPRVAIVLTPGEASMDNA